MSPESEDNDALGEEGISQQALSPIPRAKGIGVRRFRRHHRLLIDVTSYFQIARSRCSDKHRLTPPRLQAEMNGGILRTHSAGAFVPKA
jgi:hypothetical protein